MVLNRLANLWVVTVVGIFLTSGTGFAGDSIKLGVAGAHSGDLASYGIPAVRAAELVVQAVNAKGGILGKKI